MCRLYGLYVPFWNHSKQHSSKTLSLELILLVRFWNHSKQHSSKTEIAQKDALDLVLEPFETTQL